MNTCGLPTAVAKGKKMKNGLYDWARDAKGQNWISLVHSEDLLFLLLLVMWTVKFII